MFHALHKVDMHVCYAKQKINSAYPYRYLLKVFTTDEEQIF